MRAVRSRPEPRGPRPGRGLLMLAAVGCALLAAYALPAPQPPPPDVDSNSLDAAAGPPHYYRDSVLRDPDEDSGARVSAWSADSNVNPEELGEYAEGDILFPRGSARNGLVASEARWPDGVVYYRISPSFSSEDQELIQQAFRHYHEFTCVKFVPYSGQQDYIYITRSNTGCWSSVGRVGGMQEVNLQSPGCTSTVGTPIHELMHALGFLHEQNRWERDRYVRIYWQNIQSGRQDNFQAASKETTEDYGVAYDYDSVMHYSAYAFSRNGRPTIEPLESSANLGQRKGLSSGDVKKINAMYGCKSKRNSSIAQMIDDISSLFG